jgi:hypothetical protein
LVSIVTRLCMRNPNSSSDPILDSHLSLVFFFFLLQTLPSYSRH